MSGKKSILYLFLLILMGISLTSCLSKSVKLQEAVPGGQESADESGGISPVSGMVVEIEEVGGEQKYIYMKLGYGNRGIKKGIKGYIFNDPAMREKIGKFVFVEVYKDFSKGRILELNYKIKPNALVLIEVDPKKLIK